MQWCRQPCINTVLVWFIVVFRTYGIRGDSECNLMLVESIPTNMTYPLHSPSHPSTFQSWLWLLGNATTHVNISSFYWTLLNRDVTNMSCPTARDGETIFKILITRATQKNITISVVNNGDKLSYDLQTLKAYGGNVHLLNVKRLMGAGILHTKMWTVDGHHAYLGSANMDWRSLTEVKELGVYIRKCPRLVEDLIKIQDTYRLLSGPNSSIPSGWPTSLHTNINITNPLDINLNGIQSQIYIAGSPSNFTVPSRTMGYVAITNAISEAKKFVYVAVMDYFPLIVSYSHKRGDTFWPVIDNALRQAAIDRAVEVRLLVSHWPHTNPTMWNYMRSIEAIHGDKVSISVKSFEVPGSRNTKIPFSRVNHNKYMVTDNTAYIGTSNWSGDYFVYTCGVGLVIKEKQNSSIGIRGQLQAVFERDWDSPYAHALY